MFNKENYTSFLSLLETENTITLSDGTLLSKELLSKFIAFDKEFFAGHYKEIRNDAELYLKNDYSELAMLWNCTIPQIKRDFEEIGSNIVDGFIDSFNDHCPDGYYFGTLDGDGASFGFYND
tara:strand:+ start:782 stop:1147 length:366 start_codon:yes stop_codon:yes gene_type:complete